MIVRFVLPERGSASANMALKLVFLLTLIGVCFANQSLKWDDLEEENTDSNLAEFPLLGRSAGIEVCPVPAAPKNSKVQCRKGRGRRMCRAICLKGYKLPDGETEQIITCLEEDGAYTPKDSFADCEAHCEKPCQNGGKCIGNDECVCEAAFRGDLCQYPVSLCDGHFSEFLGTWRCGHKKNGTDCEIGCPSPFYFSFESPKIHSCSLDGVWTPPNIPTCIADDPDLELVPGEVTRDEMEDKNHRGKKADDDDEYEIYETINADKPVEQTNSIVIEAQDATHNIKRKIRCPKGKVRVKCASDCQATCQNPSVVCPPVEQSAECEEGCACAEGFVALGDTCVPRQSCPCYHEGFAFNHGHYIVQDCNTCTCHEGDWQCTNEVCDSECSVLMNTFYRTFDGHAYFTGAGPCLMVLMQVTNGAQILQDRTSCPEESAKVCVGDLVINLGEQALRVTSDRRVLLDHREISRFPAELRRGKIIVTRPSHEFVQVNVDGISILTNGESQMSIKASATFFNRTVGLCGTFNHKRVDDFTTPNNDVTTSASSFAEQWTVGEEQCRFIQAGDCSNVLDQEERRAICENLVRDSSIFPTCLDKIAPELHYEQCMEAMCTCSSSAEDCLCPFLSHYSRLCSNKGSITDWTRRVPQCARECHHGMRYQHCSTACHSTCAHRSYFGRNCSEACVEGCACPGGHSLSSEGVCVPYDHCSCYFDGKEYQDGFKHIRNHEECLCRKGLWECEATTEKRDQSDVEVFECGPNEVFAQCVDQCAPTCDALTEVLNCDNTICSQGCQCAEGFVRNTLTGKCVKRRDCPCFHGGRKYNEGEKVSRGCNKCTCTNSTWSCTNDPCPVSCDVWGDTHVKTFDNQMIDFEGTCDYVVAKADRDPGNAGFFQIVLRNFRGFAVMERKKSILIQYENQSVVLTETSWVTTSPESSLQVQRIGALFMKVSLPNQITIYWDRETRLHVIAGVQWKERISGLCGNFNGDDTDELKTSSGGPLANSVTEFVKSWQLHAQCKLPQVRNIVCQESNAKVQAELKCQVLRGPLFEDCHNEVDVEPYFKRCVADACSCSDIGECDCFCTAVAVYAHQCAQKGVLIHWRRQELCPLQCDEDCEKYTPCVSDTCKNAQTCKVVVEQGVQLNCAEPYCVEGCSIPSCKPGFVHPNETTHECLPATTCATQTVERTFCQIGYTTYREGQRIEQADPCVSCFCIHSESKCIGRPCAESRIVDSNCFEGWSDWLSDTSPSSAFGHDAEYLAHHRCPLGSIQSVECRRIHDHVAWNQTHAGVTCDIQKGLRCEPQNFEPCADWEMRVLCSCANRTEETTELIPVPDIHEQTVCPPGQQWSSCALNCAQTCHKFLHDLVLQGQCLNQECIPGCAWHSCQAGQVYASPGECVQLSACPCVRTNGEIVAPGAVFLKDECTECQCLNNDFVCQRLSKCDQKRESSEIEISRVDPPDGCWTQWISTDNAAGAGDFEDLREFIKTKLVCEEPKAIQCQTKESHRSPGGIDWTATGQNLTCDVNHGLSCFHMANPRDGCFDYQVKFYCPCDQIEQHTRVIIEPTPSTITVEFVCPEPNGLFPDPQRCDHFYHCSNNFPFHKPCPKPTLFNVILKICDHPENVDCRRAAETSVTQFICPSSMGFFPDVNNCNWFYHCVQNVAYHKLCPAALSFNPQSGTCDFISNCRNEHDSSFIVPVPVPEPLPIPVETGESHIFIPTPMTFACPEALPGTVQTCGHCSMGLLCDGFGSCVPPEHCPCVKDGKQFPVGGRIESTTCQECICQIGGHSMCTPIVCPLCPNGIVGVLDNTCKCNCGDFRVITECPRQCGNGQCLDISRWCDGIVDCDNDETQCSNSIDGNPDPFPSYDLIHGPATCELIGSQVKTFDGRDLSYDYCHNTLAEDVANKLFRVSVSRECASHSECGPRVVFEGGNQHISVDVKSQSVFINNTRFGPAQLASANLGEVVARAVGDLVEIAYQNQIVKLVVNENSVRLTVDGRFKNQVMGLCGLFNYEGKDDFTNTAGMVIDNPKQFGDSWALPLSPGAICVSHACKPEITIEAMRICEKLSVAPLSACTGLQDSFKNCLAYTCQCLQGNKTESSCLCDAFVAFQKSCVDTHGSQIINEITGWRQQYSCVPKCPPDQEYRDCGPTCVVTCQNFFETGKLSCVSDTDSCIPGCFCPPGFVLDYTTNTCIEPDTCADKVCVGYGDPKVKTFDGYSFSLDKSGAFNIATDRDGLFTVRGLNAPCSERLTCVVGLEVEHKGNVVKIERNHAVTINGVPYPEDSLPWKAPTAALSVFSLQSGSVGTTVVSLSRLSVQVHYSHESASFSIHVPSKKFFDKMEGLCGNCNNDPKDDLKLKDGETTDDIYGFICSWGHFETEQNRRECVMEIGREDIVPPGPVVDACEQVFNNPTTFSGCHALVDYKPYAEQCSKETAAMSAVENGYKQAVCSSALEYSRRCCEHGVSLQWWTNLGCDTTCPGDLIYVACTDACPQSCEETPPDKECHKIRMHGCICPPEHVRYGTRCLPKSQVCTTTVENCNAVGIPSSAQTFEHRDPVHGLCTNPEPIENATMCSGACSSVSLFKHEFDVESSCGCCVPFRWTPILIPLQCADGELITREFRQPISCKCEPCGSLDSRRNRFRALPAEGAATEETQSHPELSTATIPEATDDATGSGVPGSNHQGLLPIPIPRAQ